MENEQPLWQVLDRHGVPWRETRATLISRHGIKICPWYGVETVFLSDASPLLQDMLRPLEFRVSGNISSALPPARLHGLLHAAGGDGETFARALSHFEALFGRGENCSASNTQARLWRMGRAGLTATIWPHALNSQFPFQNPTHDRFPFLKEACHLAIDTGYRLPLSDREREWLDRFAPLPWPDDGSTRPYRIEGSPDHILEVMRRKDAARRLPDYGVGLGGKGEALIVSEGQDVYIFPVPDITAIGVTRWIPGQGSGGAKLWLRYASDLSNGVEKTFDLMDHPHADGLNAAAGMMASRLQKPLRLEPYFSD